MGERDHPSSYLVGIDVGTSFSAGAFTESGDVRVVSLGEEGVSIPSVMALDDDGQWLFGNGADRSGATSPEMVIREFKRRHGDATPFVIGGTMITAGECMAAMYDEMARRISEQRGAAPHAIALAHPANWGRFKVDLLNSVLATSTQPPTLLVPEPLAAARAFVDEERTGFAPTGEKLAVYDLGGGTFDAAIVLVTAESVEMLGIQGGVERLGGIDVDAALWHRVLAELAIDPDDVDAELDPGVVTALARLRADLVQAKHLLSIQPDVVVPVLLPAGVRRVQLDRTEFDRMVLPIVDRSIDHLVEMIEGNGLDSGDIGRVILVGGSSSIPLVERRVSERTGITVGRVSDPQSAIARGAALMLHDTLWPKRGISPAANGEGPGAALKQGRPDGPNASQPVNTEPRDETLGPLGGLSVGPEVLGQRVAEGNRRWGRRVVAGVVAVLVVAALVAAVSQRRPSVLPQIASSGSGSSNEVGDLEIIESGPTTAGEFGDNSQSLRFPSSGPLAPFSTSWEYPTPLVAWNGITVNDGVIYAMAVDPDDRVVAIDIESGRELWSVEGFLVRDPLVWSDRVILTESGDQVRGVDRDGGDNPIVLVEPESSGNGWIGDVEVADNVAYHSRTDSNDDQSVNYVVTALDLTVGEVAWNTRFRLARVRGARISRCLAIC